MFVIMHKFWSSNLIKCKILWSVNDTRNWFQFIWLFRLAWKRNRDFSNKVDIYLRVDGLIVEEIFTVHGRCLASSQLSVEIH